jgi:hypothetical protein
LNASVVVAARAMEELYSHMVIYQAPDRILTANVLISLRDPSSGTM